MTLGLYGIWFCKISTKFKNYYYISALKRHKNRNAKKERYPTIFSTQQEYNKAVMLAETPMYRDLTHPEFKSLKRKLRIPWNH